jgi:hypothetical protein
MKVRLPFMVQDQYTAAAKGLDKPIQGFDWDDEQDQPEVFLDGPVSTRVAVLDFDEKTGALHPPVLLDRTGKRAEYDVPRTPTDRQFQSVSAFATVMRTIALYESAEVLGRRIRWAFDGPQLLVVPRAGTWKNAYYERESHSLQFFSFAGRDDVPVVHTSLSFDIISHETGHAILDAIAPHLYDCVTPQSLALHEAVGDLTALFSTLDISHLREQLLDQTNGDIRGINAYSQVAEEFGMYTGRGGALRSLWNDMTLASVEDPDDFHDLSQLLTGAVYRVLVDYYEARWRKRSGPGEPDLSLSGKELWAASQAMKRFALRGLDYLPPGEVSFADYGRAVIAADAVANPDNEWFRTRFAEELATRIGVEPGALAFAAPAPEPIVEPAALASLVASDWHAYELVGNRRDAFHVPDGVPFQVEPRLEVTKTTFRSSGEAQYSEVIVKVSWEVAEGARRKRWVRFGTTMAIGTDGRPMAVVTSNPSVVGEDHTADRERFVERLIDAELLADGPGPADINAVVERDALRLAGTGRCLHVAADAGPPVGLLDGSTP